MKRLLPMVLVAAACGHHHTQPGSDGGNPDGNLPSDGSVASDGGGPDLAHLTGSDGGTTPTVLGGVMLPWSVWDGSVPDVPLAAAPGKTWYCDAKNGDDALDGSSFTKQSSTAGPKRTLTALVAGGQLGAGDTILLGGGLYRERPSFESLSATASAPITIGSYGRGTGAPILDGGIQPNNWTQYTARGQTKVWQSSTSGLSDLTTRPVLGIYVNGPSGEAALREVIHGQVTPYGSESLPPNQTQADLTDNSNHWYFDASAKILYADFGGTLGSGDPNSADVSILYNSSDNHEPLIVLSQGHDHLRFIGLTLRAASWNALYSEASDIRFEHCDVKFNGGGGLFFGAGQNDIGVTDNHAVENRIWMNVLDNWPRFNNGNTGGGWPGGLSFYSQSNVLAQGNAVYQNGGEGLILWGTNASGATAHVSQNNQVRNNVVFDNFSVNFYFDNTQNALVEQNFAFDHPRDASQTFDNLLTTSNGYNQDFGKRLTPVNLSLADEPGSSFEAQGQAHLANMTVINNLFAGGNFGFVDYDDGTSVVLHGLKGCVIANNTWILAGPPIPGQSSYGWRHDFAGNSDPSMSSFFENNLFAVSASDDHFVETLAAAGPGITDDYNLYSGGGGWTTDGNVQDFASWKSAHAGWDGHSLTGDPKLTDASEFAKTAAEAAVYDWSKARLLSGSPAFGAGVDQSSRFTTDFTGATRTSSDIGALAQ